MLDLINNPLEATAEDFTHREQALIYAQRFGEDVVTRVTMVTTERPEEAGHYARCAAHLANIYLEMTRSWLSGDVQTWSGVL